MRNAYTSKMYLTRNGDNFEEGQYFMMTQNTMYKDGESPLPTASCRCVCVQGLVICVPRISGLENTLTKLMSGQCSNVYYPASIAGINAWGHPRMQMLRGTVRASDAWRKDSRSQCSLGFL